MGADDFLLQMAGLEDPTAKAIANGKSKRAGSPENAKSNVKLVSAGSIPSNEDGYVPRSSNPASPDYTYDDLSRELINSKKAIQDSFTTAITQTQEYQAYRDQGMSASQAFARLDKKYGSIKCREDAINRLVKIGIPRDVAEESVPKNFDMQLKEAKAAGISSVEVLYADYQSPNGNPFTLTDTEKAGIMN